MFVYQNRAGDVCISVNSNRPDEVAEYVIKLNEAGDKLVVNGTEIDPATADAASEEILDPVDVVESDAQADENVSEDEPEADDEAEDEEV